MGYNRNEGQLKLTLVREVKLNTELTAVTTMRQLVDTRVMHADLLPIEHALKTPTLTNRARTATRSIVRCMPTRS